jgi:hypothetical protein
MQAAVSLLREKNWFFTQSDSKKATPPPPPFPEREGADKSVDHYD